MNNEEILKIKSLKEEKRNIRTEIHQIIKFKDIYGSSFKYQDSIDSLNRIHEYFCKQCDRSKEIDQEIAMIAKILGKSCNHYILLRYYLAYECPICKMTYQYSNNFPSTNEYVISDFDYDKETNIIDEMVLNSSDEETAESKILNYFNELQYSNDVKIRRRTK